MSAERAATGEPSGAAGAAGEPSGAASDPSAAAGDPSGAAGGAVWADSHCHLGYGSTIGDHERVASIVDRARAAGVGLMITVATNRQHSLEQLDVASRFDDVHATVGLHPHDAVDGVDSIVDLLGRPGVVAIGECGLDYHYDHSPRDVQRAAFAAQVALANERGLPLVIHTREAWADTFDILATEGTPERTIFHCFTGGPDEAARCVALGAYLSFSGIVTFNGAAEVRDAARQCPADRLLVETDSPYLAPVPHRGKTNEPAYVAIVGRALASIRGVDPAEIAYRSLINTTVAFRLKTALA